MVLPDHISTCSDCVLGFSTNGELNWIVDAAEVDSIGEIAYDPGANSLSVMGELIIDNTMKLQGVTLTGDDIRLIKQHIYNHGEVDMWTAWNIFVVGVICILVTKLVIPNLTLKKVVRVFAKLIYWPFKRTAQRVEEEVKQAIDENQ